MSFVQREYASVIEKYDASQEGSKLIRCPDISRQRRHYAQRDKGNKRHDRHPIDISIAPVWGRQYTIACSLVVVSVQPCDRHEMGKLPEKENRVEDPRPRA